MNYLKLIRPVNLLFIAMVQLFLKYGLFQPFGIDITLNALGFSMLIIATVCIAAGGYVINDIYDVDIDSINKPTKVIVGKKISEKAANRFYIALNVIGVGIGFYLSNMIGRPGFAALFIVISALLYLYASYLKSMLLVGNLLISVLVALSIIIVGLFDLLPVITDQNRATQSTIFSILLDYALFAFLLNFIREIVKDMQDINGDKNGGMNTLPIAIGRKRTIMIVFVLGALTMAAVIAYMYVFLYDKQWTVLYFLLLIIAPLLLFCVKAWTADSTKDYRFLSLLLKWIMFFGMGSILLYQFVLLE
jgi:4-hydroxybenzoate polyprenyltransferase